jgi:hypothetical protein
MDKTYGIGGTEVRLDASEAILEIPQNKTLLVEKLTTSTPVKPEIITGLKTIEDVFDKFKPEIDVEYENADGSSQKENIKFSSLSDFGLKGITRQSNFLGDLTTEKEQYAKIIKVLKNHKVLKLALANPDAKLALISAIKGLIAELEESEKK